MTGVQYIAAKFIEKAAADLAETIAAMPEDRLSWRPEPDSRPGLEQVIECSLANVMWANTLRTRTHEWLPEGVADRAYSTLDNLEKVTDRLLSSASALAEVIRAIEPSELKDQINENCPPAFAAAYAQTFEHELPSFPPKRPVSPELGQADNQYHWA